MFEENAEEFIQIEFDFGELDTPEWQRYGYYSEESFNHYLNRQEKVFLGELRSLKTWCDFYGLKQRLYRRDTQKHQSLFHPWRKQTLMEMKPQR